MGLDQIRAMKEAAKLPKEKKVYRIPKKSAKKIAVEKMEKQERGDGDTELQTWFKARQRQLTGKCMRCGTPYNHKVLKYAICATAHILAKRDEMFPSVKYHRDNFIELGSICGCHHWYDNQASWEQIALSNIWPMVLEKFLLFEPYITERTLIPEVLSQEIKPKL